MKYLLWFTVPALALDQWTKWQIRERLDLGTELPVIPGFFSIVHVANTGAAFGLLQGNNLLFVVLAVVATAVILILLWRNRRSRPGATQFSALNKTALALLLAGILGNLFDRLAHGQVTDFLHFYHDRYEWPSFNVADSCICVAAGLLIIDSFRSNNAQDKPDAQNIDKAEG
ncbi:MAG TPA: signal peptidase II [Chthoniobacterales bacterium]